jgi:hypothetical protein
MKSLVPVIAVWVGLCAVLVGYIIYRFITDRTDGSPHHGLYPLISRPTDPAFPPKGAWLMWAAYICLMAVPASILIALASEVGLISVSFPGAVALFGLIAGLSLLALAKRVSRSR